MLHDTGTRVPGESHGADGEVAKAIANGQPAIRSKTARIEDCLAAVEEWLQNAVA